MRQLLILILLLVKINSVNAQYSKNKLMTILTDNNSKSWLVKSGDAMEAKSYTFNKSMTVEIVKNSDKKIINNWTLTTTDNIRWFVTVGNQKFELIVSYDKTGKQYLKLNHQPTDNKISVYEETILYPLK